MASILSTGTSALASFRRALDTIGHNVANVNTEGYSRQRVVLTTREPQFTGAGFIGRGVQTVTIERNYNASLDAQVRSSSSSAARYSTVASFAGRIDNLLADPQGGLSPALSSFYASVQDFANDPSSTTSREALFAEADSLIARFQVLDDQLADINDETNLTIKQNVDEINQYAKSIAELNARIVQEGVSQPPNDLMDQRDQLIRELSSKISVNAVPQDNGSISLFIGNGQTLVIDAEAYELGTQTSEFDPTRTDVVYRGVSGVTPVNSLLRGGELGGLLEFRTDVLDPARRTLGATAMALGTAFNEQNRQGLDASGALGGDIFSLPQPRAISSNLNSGDAAVSAVITDVGSLDATDYSLLYDGSSYRLFRADNNEELTLTGSGTAADPFLAGGVALTLTGTSAAGDRYLIQPTINGASGLARSATNGAAFSAAAPIRANSDPANLSDAAIDSGSVTDITNPALMTTSVIEFTGPGTYSINGAGSFAFTAGNPISVNGAEFNISGSPIAGDRFTIEANTNATGDNRNALSLAQIEGRGILDGGRVSIGQSYSSLVSSIGSTTRQAQSSADAQSVVLQGAENRRLSTSGVNLDEEAAQLVRFQQSYQAAAQIISVASSLFDTLLNATRR